MSSRVLELLTLKHTHFHTKQQQTLNLIPDRFTGANMGPIWGRQEPGGPHVPCYLGCQTLFGISDTGEGNHFMNMAYMHEDKNTLFHYQCMKGFVPVYISIRVNCQGNKKLPLHALSWQQWKWPAVVMLTMPGRPLCCLCFWIWSTQTI